MQLGWAKWVNMLGLKSGFHNILFEYIYSYNSTFIMLRGKIWWLRMPMDLMQAVAYFQFVVKNVLHGKPGSCPLPIVIYLDNMAMYWET